MVERERRGGGGGEGGAERAQAERIDFQSLLVAVCKRLDFTTLFFL